MRRQVYRNRSDRSLDRRQGAMIWGLVAMILAITVLAFSFIIDLAMELSEPLMKIMP